MDIEYIIDFFECGDNVALCYLLSHKAEQHHMTIPRFLASYADMEGFLKQRPRLEQMIARQRRVVTLRPPDMPRLWVDWIEKVGLFRSRFRELYEHSEHDAKDVRSYEGGKK